MLAPQARVLPHENASDASAAETDPSQMPWTGTVPWAVPSGAVSETAAPVPPNGPQIIPPIGAVSETLVPAQAPVLVSGARSPSSQRFQMKSNPGTGTDSAGTLTSIQQKLAAKAADGSDSKKQEAPLNLPDKEDASPGGVSRSRWFATTPAAERERASWRSPVWLGRLMSPSCPR